MKKVLFVFIAIHSQMLFSQVGLGVNAQSFYETLYFKNNKYEYKDIKGSPYLNTEFKLADVGANYKDIPTRYNSYTDSFEFKKDESIYVIPKEDNLSKIVFKNTKQTFILIPVNDTKMYLEQINGSGLLKKRTTVFKEFRKATSSYEQDVPASFENIAPKYYYLSKEGKVTELSKKSIANSLPEKEKELKSFMKQNNLSFDKESDLLKIADFLDK